MYGCGNVVHTHRYKMNVRTLLSLYRSDVSQCRVAY